MADFKSVAGEIAQLLRGFFRGQDPPRGDFGTPQEGDEREHFGKDVMDDFLARNAVLWVQSSWVSYARYHKDRFELEIGFKDGWTAFYGRCSADLARSFAEAPSKGKWTHTHLKAGYQADGRHWIHTRPYRGG